PHEAVLEKALARGVFDEEADEDEPATAIQVVRDKDIDAEHANETAGHHAPCDQAAAPGGDAGSPVVVPREQPDQRAKDPAAVHRECGQKVEDTEHNVDAAEKEEHVVDWTAILGTESEPGTEKCRAEDDAGERPRERHEQFVERLRGLARYLRDAAKDEERDALDGDAIALGDDAMGQFVQDDADKKEDDADGRHDEVRTRAGRGKGIGIDLRGEEPRDDAEQQEPAGVHQDGDAKQGAQTNVPHNALTSIQPARKGRVCGVSSGAAPESNFACYAAAEDLTGLRRRLPSKGKNRRGRGVSAPGTPGGGSEKGPKSRPTP